MITNNLSQFIQLNHKWIDNNKNNKLQFINIDLISMIFKGNISISKLYNNLLSENIMINNLNFNIEDLLSSNYLHQKIIPYYIEEILDIIFNSYLKYQKFIEAALLISKFNIIIKYNLSYIKYKNLLHEYIFLSHTFINNDELYNNVLPYLDKEDLTINICLTTFDLNFTCLENLFLIIMNKYQADFIKLCITYFNRKELLMTNKNDSIFFPQSLFIKIDNEFKVDVVKFLLSNSYIIKEDLDKESSEGLSSWNLFFNTINNKYNIEIVKLLLSYRYITKEVLKCLNSKNYVSCWYQILYKVNNEYQLEIIKLLLPYLEKQDLLIKKDNKTCWHLLFYNIDNKYRVETIELLLPYLNREYLLFKDNENKNCIHYLACDNENDYKIQVIKLILPYLEKED